MALIMSYHLINRLAFVLLARIIRDAAYSRFTPTEIVRTLQYLFTVMPAAVPRLAKMLEALKNPKEIEAERLSHVAAMAGLSSTQLAREQALQHTKFVNRLTQQETQIATVVETILAGGPVGMDAEIERVLAPLIPRALRYAISRHASDILNEFGDIDQHTALITELQTALQAA